MDIKDYYYYWEEIFYKVAYLAIKINQSFSEAKSGKHPTNLLPKPIAAKRLFAGAFQLIVVVRESLKLAKVHFRNLPMLTFCDFAERINKTKSLQYHVTGSKIRILRSLANALFFSAGDGCRRLFRPQPKRLLCKLEYFYFCWQYILVNFYCE